MNLRDLARARRQSTSFQQRGERRLRGLLICALAGILIACGSTRRDTAKPDSAMPTAPALGAPALGAPALGAPALGTLVDGDAAEREETERRPSNWFMQQRLSSSGMIPVGARRNALAAMRKAGQTEAAGTWTAEGPQNVGGRVTAMGVDPNVSSRIWIGTADAGVWRSEDSGVNWTPVFDDQSTLSIGAIVTHPTLSNVLYVGTGEDNGGGYSYDGDGIYKSEDGGDSWTHLGLAETRRMQRIAIDPANPDRLFVAAGGDVFNRDNNRGVYRSTDGGLNWSQVLFVADDTGAIDVQIDPSNPNRIFAATWQRISEGANWTVNGIECGVYRSVDGGDNWTRLAGGLPSDADVGRIGLAIAPSSPQIVYANVIGSNGRIRGIYKSTDSGDSWTKVNNFIIEIASSGFSYYFGKIRVDPLNPDVVYVLDQQMWRSTNGGNNFNTFAGSVHVDHHALQVDGAGRLYSGNDGGFYSSFNNGTNWTQSTTLQITQFYDIGIDTLDPNRRFGGAQDNGTNRTTTGGLNDWTNVLGGDGMETEVDPTDSDFVYAESQFGNINRSVDGGDSFVSAQNGIDGSERANWVTPIVLDPTVPSTLYTGYQRVYRSTDRAQNWTAISPDLTICPTDHCAPDFGGGGDGPDGEAHTQNLIRETITAIGVSPVDPDVLWAGTDNGLVWSSGDGGANWTEWEPLGLRQWVTDFAADPFEADKVYLTVTGYRVGTRVPYMLESDDLGATWRDIGGGLPQVPTNSVVADPLYKGQLFVGTDVGVYLTDDGGASWQRLGDNLPNVVIQDLVLHQPSRTLYAGTFGRGLQTFDLNQLPIPDRDSDGVLNVDDCAPEDGGSFAAPDEVTGLRLDAGAGQTDLSWDSLATQAGSGVVYDVAVGSLASLQLDGGTANAGELVCGAATNSTGDPFVPTVGEGRYYLVRGRNACADGDWGRDSDGTLRSAAACP